MAMQIGVLNPLHLKDPKIRTLHFTWVAFFISFLVWFNHAPLMSSIRTTLNLSDQEVKTLLILNVALTIPARIIIGMAVDKFGPRIMFSSLLVVSGVLCLGFATATDFQTLALTRFLLGFVGAGFVIGIRLVGEWFPARQVGLAEGIYGGWGNFGSAAAAIILPTLALWFGGEEGWRYAVGVTGVIAMVYGVAYYFRVSNTPKGSTYFKPKKTGALEVSSPGDFVLYAIMNAPMVLALGVLAWKVGPANLGLLSSGVTYIIYAVLTLIYIFQIVQAYRINRHVFCEKVPEIDRYKFRQVAVLDLAYMVTFGSELAVVSMLPLFFMDTFGLSLPMAGLLAASFAFTNFFARPGGGWMSDKFGRKRTLIILLSGVIAGYFTMSLITTDTLLILAVLATIICSVFVNAGNGAIYAVVPLIKRRLTGQVAGMVGAYGNVGGVVFLTVLSFATPQIFFLVIAAAAIATLVAAYFFLDEPQGTMAEVLPDGTVQMIEVG